MLVKGLNPPEKPLLLQYPEIIFSVPLKAPSQERGYLVSGI
jgi:hypothetical protein